MTREQPRLLHLGCGTIAPTEWLNVDGSFSAWLARHPWINGLLRMLRPRSALQTQWPPNVYVANLRKPMPWANGSFHAAYSSHLLEHLHYEDAIRLLKEIYRVLEPGGICRMLVPDVAAIVSDYL